MGNVIHLKLRKKKYPNGQEMIFVPREVPLDDEKLIDLQGRR
jgi:hypothetical protein